MNDSAGNGLSCADRFRLAPAVGVWSFDLSLLRLGLTMRTSLSLKPSPCPCFLFRGVSFSFVCLSLLDPAVLFALSASCAKSCCKNRLSVSIFSRCLRMASSSAFCLAASSACNFCITLSRRSYSFAAFSSFARTMEISPCLVAAALLASCSKRCNRVCSASSCLGIVARFVLEVRCVFPFLRTCTHLGIGRGESSSGFWIDRARSHP